MRLGVMVTPDELTRIVCPSGGDLATISDAIEPPAPGRLSGTTDWPHICESFVPMNRPVVSTPPPGASAITMRMDLEGYAGAWAQAAPAARNAMMKIRMDLFWCMVDCSSFRL